MKLFTFLAASTALFTPTLACKCFSGGNVDIARTQSCCGQLGGVFRNGNDCAAGSISQRLSAFRSCCGGQSDCDFPALAERDVDASVANNGIKTVVVTK